VLTPVATAETNGHTSGMTAAARQAQSNKAYWAKKRKEARKEGLA
jgi:hypothetical protein